MFDHSYLKKPDITKNIESVDINGFRFYKVNENYYPSVTTVTGYSKRDFFEKWANDPRNQQKRDQATERGNAIHNSLEKYLLNKNDYLDGLNRIHRDVVLLMKPFIDKHITKIHGLEFPLYSNMLKLAGRSDCVAEFDGKLSIIDFKGSFKEKKESYIENYFQQCTAYSIMWRELFGIPINQIVVMIGCETGIVQIYKKNPIDYLDSLVECVREFKKEIKNNMDYQFSKSNLLY